MSIAFGSPSRYIQGPGELSRLAEHAGKYGNRIVAVIDSFFYEDMSECLKARCEEAGQQFFGLPFSGEITRETGFGWVYTHIYSMTPEDRDSISLRFSVPDFILWFLLFFAVSFLVVFLVSKFTAKRTSAPKNSSTTRVSSPPKKFNNKITKHLHRLSPRVPWTSGTPSCRAWCKPSPKAAATFTYRLPISSRRTLSYWQSEMQLWREST